LQYIEFIHKGKRVGGYSKENLIKTIQYIKGNYDEFVLKNYQIKHNTYKYTRDDYLLEKYTFPQELIFFEILSQVIFSISIQKPSRQSILQKM
jgi:hypothetical protein